MKKAILVLAIVLLFCVIGVGCLVNKSDDEKEKVQVSGKTYKEFTAFFAVPGTELDENNVIQNLIADATGIKVHEKWLGSETAYDAISELLESGDYPDFVDAGEESVRMYEAGALVALDDYIEKYPNVKELFSQKQWNSLRQSDGHIYWIPQFSSTYGKERVCVHIDEAFWIQTRVLEWAGYPEIHTLDQYFDLIERYYAAKPTMSDGTAVIPYTILCDDWRYFCLENAPQFLDGYPNDGAAIVDPQTYTVIDYNTTDTAVQYFKKLNEEYKKGIVDPEFYKQTYDEYIAKLSSGRVLGMVDQWWDFAYEAEDAIRHAGLDDEGCQYVPLPITIREGITNQWHNSGSVFHGSSGLAITKSCKDVDKAMEFVSALLEQDIHDLRYWGIEGVDYVIDDNGMFKKTKGMRKMAFDTAYKKAHFCQYNYFPQWLGTSRDGINAMKPEGQEVEFYDGLSDKVRKCLTAYDAQTYVEMLGSNPSPGPWYPIYTYAQALSPKSDEGEAYHMMTECKHNYLPQVVMANNFEKTWAEYMEAYNSCHPERFLNGLQNEVNRRVEAAADYEQ
ncbi:putative aldouronate transport system substrate-binding protein [Butyrivibrio sp. Su6]|uniref:extracellular solute-binding protein n=1 Tax=Butyrivibrio sp. Su6 TaxID=1520810 RepID=UPI00089EF46F|nr:extracellular solute-binding protein [Butyrivibrio sp. Su6]SEF73364.1 putative aldouronate transport system substrate-binding protein [Butyrivibrio sp. Su6]